MSGGGGAAPEGCATSLTLDNEVWSVAMDQRALMERLRLGEDSETALESVAHDGFQLTSALQEGMAREIAGLANAGGGLLVLGAEDSGEVTGTGTRQQSDGMLRQITQICHTQIQPALHCHTKKLEIDGKIVIVVEVPPWSPDRPYRTDSTYHVRDGTMAREATRDELIRMLHSQAIHLDEQPARGASREDLDDLEIQRFFKATYPTEVRNPATYLRALKCLDGEVPTVTGILFFGKEPQRFFPDAVVLGIQFPGGRAGLTMKDKKELHGTLFHQMEAAQEFLSIHVPSPSTVEGWTRKERGIPVPVLREALQNALAHRDYNAAAQTRIFVYDDRVEIINPGILLNRLTKESITLGGISQKRNPAIAALLARKAGRENAGLGVPAMFDIMREAGLPEPEIDLAGGHFKIVLRWVAPKKASG